MIMKTLEKQKINSWTCPQCGRMFKRMGQSHSCKTFPLEQHFIGKEKFRKLFDKLGKAITTRIGPFKIDSIECCIHLVHKSTFVAVKVMKNNLRIDFSLDYKPSNPRIGKTVKMSENRYLHYVDITMEDDINTDLLQWLKDAYFLK